MSALLAAAAFVALWSTGFIVARAIHPYADPNLYLLARFGGTALLFALIALTSRARWPARREWGRQLLAGALLQGVYLGASYWAVAQGLPAGVMALLGALQPLATAVLAVPLFGERLPARGWAGMALGVAGVALVLAPKLAAAGSTATAHGAAGASAFTVLVAVLSIASITAGSLYQKSAVAQTDLRTAVAIQNAGAALVAAAFALALGETHWQPAPTLWLGLAWGIAMLSGGAIVLFVWLLRHGGAARATSLMFLAPPLAALQGYWLFGETLGALQLAGFAVALAGVALARWSR
ncbi:DMT family transporter [Burkholderia gladioli]|uniref:DMT family transporter n=1 Tax=Burkholderia gladioli TaxID=28095 RepID=UPI00163E5693|nr:DMT family transporter [Burkholderia gladioli]MBU9171659.1 DMT family transporter [Burkholderia gladioli]MBU9218374.1 DMT family transporter [Burkholderia gladioli]MBU9383622.1 DMT family transporter [Burkholderia gladioli]MDN7727974.1 DMT family transporter [Burkholderia gladioli]